MADAEPLDTDPRSGGVLLQRISAPLRQEERAAETPEPASAGREAVIPSAPPSDVLEFAHPDAEPALEEVFFLLEDASEVAPNMPPGLRGLQEGDAVAYKECDGEWQSGHVSSVADGGCVVEVQYGDHSEVRLEIMRGATSCGRRVEDVLRQEPQWSQIRLAVMTLGAREKHGSLAHGPGHVAFSLRVAVFQPDGSLVGDGWTVERRYSEFDGLRREMLELCALGDGTDARVLHRERVAKEVAKEAARRLGKRLEALPFPAKLGLLAGMLSEQTPAEKAAERRAGLAAWLDVVLTALRAGSRTSPTAGLELVILPVLLCPRPPGADKRP
jgi:hypothetical protein